MIFAPDLMSSMLEMAGQSLRWGWHLLARCERAPRRQGSPRRKPQRHAQPLVRRAGGERLGVSTL
eukprot:COSAG06_NODE_9549_length_1873_cov_4.401353_2_plen_65_part_00